MDREESKSMSIDDMPVPPATFDFLVSSLKVQAEIQLGRIHFGEEKDRPEPQLGLARHAIDMLAMLLEKTKGNLSLDEQRLLENSVTELRFLYIQAAERPRAPKPEEPTSESTAQTNG
jgi:hypothetical protein